jgi:RNA polymerase sigma-70 factor (ECF subfamily)
MTVSRIGRSAWYQGHSMNDRGHDASVLSGLRDRDEAALARLFDLFGGAVHGVARRLLRDDALAEDVTQEVFLRLWRRPERFDPARGTLRAFLLRDAHGRSIDLIRSEESRRAREEQDASRSSAQAPGPEQEAWEAVRSEKVRAALAALPDLERDSVVLAYFGGLSYREVAQRLGQPEGTTKSRIRAAMQRLRGTLMSQGIVET